MTSLLKSILIIVLLSEVESIEPDFNQYECKDQSKTNNLFKRIRKCWKSKHFHWFDDNSPQCCRDTEMSCIALQLINNECKLNKAANDWISSLKDSAIKECSSAKMSNETDDSYYRRVCPEFVKLLDSDDFCLAYIPCTLSPDSVVVFQSDSGSLQSMAQILAILSIIAILYANIY